MFFSQTRCYRTIAGITLGAIPLGAQENAKEVPVPNAEDITIQTQTPKTDAAKDSEKRDNKPGAPGTEPDAVKQQRKADAARDERKRAAEQRQEKDLVAQQGMAKSAHDLVVLTRWQIFFGVLALLGLAATVMYARQTARSASSGVKVAIATAERQLRAFIAIEPGDISPFTYDIEMLAYVGYKNAGHMPATKVRYFAKAEFSTDRERSHFQNDDKLWGNNVISPGVVMTQATRTVLTEEQVEAVKRGDGYVYVWGTVSYTDGFKDRKFTNFCYRYNFRSYSALGEPFLSGKDARHHEHGNSAN